MPYNAYKEDELDKKEAYKQNLLRQDQEPESDILEDILVFKNFFKYPKTNQFHVHFSLESGRNALFVLIYSAGETMEDVKYLETQVTDGDIPSIEFFEDPDSEEAKVILDRYGLTPDQIQNANIEAYEMIEIPHSKEEDIKESLEFEKTYSLIMSSEQKANEEV